MENGILLQMHLGSKYNSNTTNVHIIQHEQIINQNSISYANEDMRVRVLYLKDLVSQTFCFDGCFLRSLFKDITIANLKILFFINAYMIKKKKDDRHVFKIF